MRLLDERPSGTTRRLADVVASYAEVQQLIDPELPGATGRLQFGCGAVLLAFALYGAAASGFAWFGHVSGDATGMVLAVMAALLGIVVIVGGFVARARGPRYVAVLPGAFVRFGYAGVPVEVIPRELTVASVSVTHAFQGRTRSDDLLESVRLTLAGAGHQFDLLGSNGAELALLRWVAGLVPGEPVVIPSTVKELAQQHDRGRTLEASDDGPALQ